MQMNNNRLVTFGCSITKGSGLSDVTDNDSHSMWAWPKILADKLKLECKNKGHGGASNKQISHDIFTFDFHLTDVVIILWSHCDRYVFFEDRNKYQTFIPSKVDKLSRIFYKEFWNRYDGVYSTLIHMNAVNRYLENLNLKYYNFLLDRLYIEGTISNKKTLQNLYNSLNVQPIDFVPYRNYGETPDGHPNEICHLKFAEAIFPLIKV